MTTFQIQVRIFNMYEKFVEADTREAAIESIQGESWEGDGWERFDGDAEIIYVEAVKAFSE
mgnify:CR=1 FL=1